MKKTYCCRYRTTDELYTATWISANDMTPQEAKDYATEQVENDPELHSVDAVYEVVNE